MTDTLQAPWTPEQVAALNVFQRSGRFHPYTCGRRSEHAGEGVLLATTAGWVCPAESCDYKQDWASAFMAQPLPEPDDLNARLAHGIEQARAGQTRDLGDFTRYLDNGQGSGMTEPTIAELADQLGEWFDADEQTARARWNRDGATSEKFHGTPYDPVRVLADIQAKRALLALALGWEHHEVDDPWFSCPASPHVAKMEIAGPCDCGRDERVLAVLQHLAQPYQETSR
jgi:hypothetical protein